MGEEVSEANELDDMDLVQMEHHAYLSYFQDGLIDMFLGALLLAMWAHTLIPDTALPRGERYAILFCLQILCGALFGLGKRYITIPRLGMVAFGPYRRIKEERIQLLVTASTLVLFVLMVILWVESSAGANMIRMGTAQIMLTSTIVLITFGLMAHWRDFKRGYFHAMVMAFTVSYALSFEDPSIFFISGMLLLTIGLYILHGFLLDNPLPEEGSAEEAI